MNPAEIVMHKMKGHLISVVLNFFAECICEPRESSDSHSHRKVLAFDVGRGNVHRVRIAHDALALAGLVTSRRFRDTVRVTLSRVVLKGGGRLGANRPPS